MIHKSLLLAGLTLVPSLNSISVPLNNSNTSTIHNTDDEVQEKESCTVMYVGKDWSTTGKRYCCRCGDSSPRGLNMNTTIFEHNQLANVVTKGKNGFEWQMPSTTYRYISTPRNPNVRNGLHWEVSTINENGVATSATLSCATNEKIQDKEVDPFITTGISEDNLAQIMGATGTSAKQCMETIAKIVDEKGSAEANIIMAMDQNEAWLMEMYSGHQYCAIKLPDDKVCTIGNEFFLDSLHDLGINESNKDEMCITSPNLFNKVKDKEWVQYIAGTKETEKDIYHLDLFHTYGGESTTQRFIDSCHMRTWRGRSLFKDKNDKYEPQKKYESFFTPSKKLSVKDIISFFRDRYESILNDSSDVNYKYFKQVETSEEGLRPVGVGATYQVHIMSVNPDLPKEIAAEETIAFSSANYTPFIPLNAGVTTMNEYYTHVSKDFGYDEQSAYCIFKRLNGLADANRTNYGLPIESYLTNHESMWQQHYNDLLTQIKSESLDVQRNVLTNYCRGAQDAALIISTELFNDLMWHIVNLNKDDPVFKPFASLEYYSWLYGWEYSKDGDIATLKSGSDTVKVDFTYEKRPAKGWVVGKLTKNDAAPINVRVSVKNDVPCIDYETANQYIAAGHELISINWKDFYIVDSSTPSWVIPVVIAAPLSACLIGIIIFSAIWQRKKKKAEAKQQA